MAFVMYLGFVCLLVCLFVHGAPVVCCGRRLTKEGPYATRRQAGRIQGAHRKAWSIIPGRPASLQVLGGLGKALLGMTQK